MPSPYRTAEEQKGAEPKTGELVYRPQGRSDRIASGSAGFQLVALPTAAGLVVGALVAVEAGLAAFALVLAGVVVRSRMRPKDVVVLRVGGGELRVVPIGSDDVLFRAGLAEIDDVVLDTKAVERVMDTGAGAVNIGIGHLAPSIASSSDTNRIVIETSRGEAHPLTTKFFGGAVEGRFLSGFSRFVLGRRAADALRLPDDAWKYAPLVVAPLRMSVESLRRLVPGARARAVRRGRAIIEEEVRLGLAGDPADFATGPAPSSGSAP